LREIFFPYKRVHSDIFGRASIPVAKIFLRGKGEIAVDAIVDSGAVISIFPKSLSELLKLSFAEGERGEVRTASGEVIGIRVHRVRMRIGDYAFTARVAFSENENIPYVLGRLDVIDKVEIRLEREGTRFLIP
jgi:predicted aspartyl protease